MYNIYKKTQGDIKMRKSKLFKIFTIVMSLIIVAISSLFVKAGNTRWTTWVFEVGSHGEQKLISTAGRDKDDSSSVYINCDKVVEGIGAKGSSFQATAYGSNDMRIHFVNCVYNGNSSRTYSVSKGSVYYMINYIYEANYRFANIWCSAPYSENVTFSGVWSPDSSVY